MNFSIDSKTEQRALLIGALLNLLMALAGWITYYFSNSFAMLLDANLSLVIFITSILAIKIVQKRRIITQLFPYGKYFLESFFILLRGIIILGITITAIINSIFTIIYYFQGESIEKINSFPILIYTILMVVLCFGLAIYYSKKNNTLFNKSSTLEVERKSSLIDGYISLVLGVGLILSTFVSETSIFNFFLYIGDSIFVLLLGLFLLKTPFEIIKNSIIELGGGVIQDKKIKDKIENKIKTFFPEQQFEYSTYCTKLGSSYYIGIKHFSFTHQKEIKRILRIRDRLYKELSNVYEIIDIEIIIDHSPEMKDKKN